MSPHRALFVDGGLTVSSWCASGTLRPFVRRILEARQTYQPALVGVAWDCPRANSWRRAISPAYKAKRPPADAKLVEARKALSADLAALDIAQYSAPEAEADDVLYTLSVQTPGPVLLMSADKDLLQAVRPGVDLLKASSRCNEPDKLVTAQNIRELVLTLQSTQVSGLDAAGWADLLILAGDSTDGISGLPGVGPRKALDLLRACPDFLDLVRQTPDQDIERARRQCLAANASLAKWVEVAIREEHALGLSSALVALQTFPIDVIDADPDEERARDILQGAGLGRFAAWRSSTSAPRSPLRRRGKSSAT